MNFSLGFFVGGQVLAGILGSVGTFGYGAPGKHGANYMQSMAASVAGMAAMGVLIQTMIWLGLAEPPRSEEHTSELQSQSKLVCRLLLGKKKKKIVKITEVKQHLRHHTFTHTVTDKHVHLSTNTDTQLAACDKQQVSDSRQHDQTLAQSI